MHCIRSFIDFLNVCLMVFCFTVKLVLCSLRLSSNDIIIVGNIQLIILFLEPKGFLEECVASLRHCGFFDRFIIFLNSFILLFGGDVRQIQTRARFIFQCLIELEWRLYDEGMFHIARAWLDWPDSLDSNSLGSVVIPAKPGLLPLSWFLLAFSFTEPFGESRLTSDLSLNVVVIV